MALRFAYAHQIEPNMEIKFEKNDTDRYAVSEARGVSVNGRVLRISPIELQIAYKVFLGSEKDLEDAYHLYEATKEILKTDELELWMAKLPIAPEARARSRIP